MDKLPGFYVNVGLIQLLIMEQKYFVLRETFIDDEIYIKDADLDENEREETISGIHLSNPKNNYEFYYDKKTIKDFTTSQLSLIVSDKIKTTLEKLGTINIKFYPATLKKTRKDKKGYSNYFLMLIKPVSFFDYNNSIYTGIAEEKYIGTIDKMVVDPTKMEDNDIVRFQELIGEVIITENLKTALESNNITGVEFIPVEKFKYPYY